MTTFAIWATGLLGSSLSGLLVWTKVGEDLDELFLWVLAPVLLFTSLRLWFG